MSKLKIIIPLALVLAGGVYKFVLAKPAPAPPMKVHGKVYVVPKEFQVNLDGGGYARFSVALVVPHDFATAPAAAGGHGAPVAPPEGYGTLEQEALVRDLIIDMVTNHDGEDLIDKEGREHLKEDIAKAINKKTDVKVEEFLFTDLAVQ